MDERKNRMAATNDITNAEIKTSAYSKQGRDNHDRIFAKKSAHEWALLDGVIIKSPDGFRWKDGVDMDTKISYKEFTKRLQHCTIYLNINQ